MTAPGYQTIEAHEVERAAWRSARARALPAGLAMAFGVYCLYLGGYRGPRLVAITAVTLLLAYGFYRGVRRRDRELGLRLVTNGLHGAVVVLSGSLESPFIALMVTVPVGATYEVRGRSARIVWIQSAVMLLSLAPLTVLWPAPPLPRWIDLLIMGLCLMLVIALIVQTAYNATQAYRQAGRDLEASRGELLESIESHSRDVQAVSAKVAHELKNPLASIKGLVDLVAKGADDERSRKRFAVMQGEIERMQHIIREYLDLARPFHALDVDDVPLHHVADEVLAIVEGRARSLSLRLSREGEATIVGDRRRIKEALINLVSNALQACESGDRIAVKIVAGDDGAIVCIEDSGRGMEPEVLTKVGTSYFTTRSDGTGLGVALTRAVIEQHGGRLRYESQPGTGTRAFVELPAAPPS